MKSDVSSPLSQCGAVRRSTANRKALGKGTPGYFYDPVTTRLSTAAATTASVEAAVSRTPVDRRLGSTGISCYKLAGPVVNYASWVGGVNKLPS